MAISAEYVLNGLKTPTAFLGEITGGRLSPTVETLVDRSAGAHWPQFVSQISGKPEISLTSQQLATLIGLAPQGFAALSGNTDLELRKINPLGGRVAEATAVHKRVRGTSAMLTLGSIRASQGQRAEAEVKLQFVYDGTNPILTVSGSVACTANAGAGEQFTLAKTSINGVAIPSVTEFSIDFGINLIVDSSAGDLNPTFVAIESMDPVITLRGVDAALLETYGININAAAVFIQYLKKRATTGQFVADATAQHCVITAGAVAIVVEEAPVGGNDRVQPSLKLIPVDASGAGSPVTMSATAAIS